MDLNLTGKTAFVCGGSQGLGLATAIELAALGATVVLASRNPDKLQQAVATLSNSRGQQHTFITIDLGNTPEVASITERLPRQYHAIDILINNAGGPPSGPMMDTQPEEFTMAFNSLFVSAHVLAQTFLPHMIQSGFGRIVNIVSTSVKQPINGLGISNSIRAAVANWAKTLANEVGVHGITVNNVLPGYTQTSRLDYLFDKQAQNQGTTKEAILEKTIASIPAGRLGQPAEFGAAVAFLCSPAAAYINGINLPIDGGRTGSL